MAFTTKANIVRLGTYRSWPARFYLHNKVKYSLLVRLSFYIIAFMSASLKARGAWVVAYRIVCLPKKLLVHTYLWRYPCKRYVRQMFSWLDNTHQPVLSRVRNCTRVSLPKSELLCSKERILQALQLRTQARGRSSWRRLTATRCATPVSSSSYPVSLLKNIASGKTSLAHSQQSKVSTGVKRSASRVAGLRKLHSVYSLALPVVAVAVKRKLGKRVYNKSENRSNSRFGKVASVSPKRLFRSRGVSKQVGMLTAFHTGFSLVSTRELWFKRSWRSALRRAVKSTTYAQYLTFLSTRATLTAARTSVISTPTRMRKRVTVSLSRTLPFRH